MKKQFLILLFVPLITFSQVETEQDQKELTFKKRIQENPDNYLNHWEYAQFLMVNVDLSSEDAKYGNKICSLYSKVFDLLFVLDQTRGLIENEEQIYIHLLDIYNAGLCPIPYKLMD